MSGARRRKWGITAAALVVVTTLIVTVWLHRGQPQEFAVSLSTSAPTPHVSEPRIRLPRDTISDAPVSTHAPTADPASNADVCGIQKVRPAGTDPADVNDGVIEATRETHNRWKAALLDSPDTPARAVGLLLQRFESLREDSAVQAEESRDELVQLAAGGGDPALYAIAVGLCQTNELSAAVTTGACQRISLTEWAHTDPSNALPWIAAAQAARASGDFQAEAAAFTRAAAAHSIRSPGESMFQFGLQEVPQDATPAEKASLSIELIGHAVASIGPELSEVMRYCSAGAVKQTQIRKDCNAVAELLVGPQTTLLYFSLGAKLGERVGWPAERVHQLSDEKEALLRLSASNTLVPGPCDSISRINTFINERERLGEIAALRELGDQREPSGQPVSRQP